LAIGYAASSDCPNERIRASRRHWMAVRAARARTEQANTCEDDGGALVHAGNDGRQEPVGHGKNMSNTPQQPTRSRQPSTLLIPNTRTIKYLPLEKWWLFRAYAQMKDQNNTSHAMQDHIRGHKSPTLSTPSLRARSLKAQRSPDRRGQDRASIKRGRTSSRAIHCWVLCPTIGLKLV
jgi:hypothetical protein